MNAVRDGMAEQQERNNLKGLMCIYFKPFCVMAKK
jgi:hypothetical protein